MWIVTALFLVVLWLAHVTADGATNPGRLHISEMRAVTPMAHVLFLLLILAALVFARRARQERHDLSAVLGVFIAFSVFVAWLTPSFSPVHNFCASVPFLLLFLYVPLMLFYGEHFLLALIFLSAPPICDALLWFSAGGSSGELQKLNALMVLFFLNFLFYRILPRTYPLLHPPYLEEPRCSAK